MKAWMLEAGPLALNLADQPDPVPGPGQVLIDVKASSLNRGEFLHGGSRVVAVKGLPRSSDAGWRRQAWSVRWARASHATELVTV